MSFLIKDELLEKYNNICNKVIHSIKKGFVIEPLYNERYLKTKMKSYEDKINASLHHDGMPKESSHCICLSVIVVRFLK